MTTLIIGNSRTEEMVGQLAALTPVERRFGGSAAMRLLAFVEPGDVVVLPYPPAADYLAYLTALLGVDANSFSVLCPPPGALGTELLTADRLADADFREQVRTAVCERGIDRLFAVYKDVSLTRFAAAVGLTAPGHTFSAQGGDALINSKAGFRAIAAGTATPIAPGLTTTQRFEAQDMVNQFFDAGQLAMVKREFSGGGLGNEILSPVAGVQPVGAPRAVELFSAAAVSDYFDRRWAELTEGGRHRVVVEQYLTTCDTVYAEYLITDDGPELSGLGQLLMEPVAFAQIVHGDLITSEVASKLLEAGRRLTTAVHGLGYRGYLSTDALLTSAGDIVLTETNGRLSGSTHLHVVVDRRILAPEHRGRRVLLERFGWAVPSFAAAVECLNTAGLGFDPSTGTGVLITSDLLPDRSVNFCAVEQTLCAAQDLERLVLALFDPADANADAAAPAGHPALLFVQEYMK